MRKNQKNPVLGTSPAGQKNAAFAQSATPLGLKVPVIGKQPESYMDLKAAWRIARCQLLEPYGWRGLDAVMMVEIHGKLSAFESMTFSEIFVRDKSKNHEINVEDIPNPLVRKWLRVNMPDRPALRTLRLAGAQRIWGYLSDGAYQIVFWDPNHKIYPSAR